MPYVLGIDIGSTNTAAGVARRRGATWARPEVVALDGGSATVPSVLHLATDGSLVVGAPDGGDGSRTARGFVRRVGDDVPLLLAGEPFPPQVLTAVLAEWVVQRVLDREGEPAEAVVLSHPAGWGGHRRELLHSALWQLGLGNVTLLPRTVTVAESHAARGFPGSTAAVYALGGNTFEAALVRRTPRGTYETFGFPQGLDWIGGADFDEALAEHVRTVLARELAAAGRRETHAALRGLLPECDRAKRELTVGTETDVLLTLPNGPVRVPVSRVRFEDMIRPAVQATVDLLARTVHSAGLRPAELDGVLLAGGSTRIPLVAELLAETFPVPVEVEPDPQSTAATGAALAACQVVSPRRRFPERDGEPAPAGDLGPAAPPAVRAQRRRDHDRPARSEPPPRPPVRITPLDLPKASRLALTRSWGREG
ncbi:Hsp70 family protein [Micromonospora sp. 4G57]|uniref:Hsp70 family protein n=1 Tax=Micromonospora sicca TaxID=2202420 RepID=A0ABU5J6B6_9ACTN|nr:MULTISPECIES: Hsp70 family protein [unclassified Micromonospora]MDZ5443385.1 Hsp70 family protein [Micromonospora sp. 4G57]MDZ5488115.1 Hsp70 family protein [Micromonospora sp. 4G53]